MTFGFPLCSGCSSCKHLLIFSPPPQAEDGEKKVLLHVCTLSTSETKQGFVYSSGTAEGQEEKGAERMLLLGGSAGIKYLFPRQGTCHRFTHP